MVSPVVVDRDKLNEYWVYPLDTSMQRVYASFTLSGSDGSVDFCVGDPYGSSSTVASFPERTAWINKTFQDSAEQALEAK